MKYTDADHSVMYCLLLVLIVLVFGGFLATIIDMEKQNKRIESLELKVRVLQLK